MFILESLNSKQNLELSLESIVSFIEKEMDTDDKIKDYYDRKFKDSKELIVVGFESICPIQLKIENRYSFDSMSMELKKDKNILNPLLISYNITNNQYKKIEGSKDSSPFKPEYNRGSFSDYYISRKVLDNCLPSLLNLETNDKFSSKPMKEEIMRSFYNLFNIIARDKAGQKEVGYEFFIDFNTIMDLEPYDEKDKKDFISKLIIEYGFEDVCSIDEVFNNNTVNDMMYLLESIEFQVENIYKIKNIHGKTITEIFQEKIELPFEVPTGEKPTLSNKRLPILEKNVDIPSVSFFEIFLLRLLVLSINKQGKVSSSGYHFKIKDGATSTTSMGKTMQITGDAYGNMSISSIKIEDVRKMQLFKERIIDSYFLFFNERLEEKQAEKIFFAKYIGVKETFFQSHVKEKELVELRMKKSEYKNVGKTLIDGVYKSISNRVLSFEEKTKKTGTYYQLIDLLFVMFSLGVVDEKKIGRLKFLTNQLRANELSKKEQLTKEEFYFLLGSISGLAIKGSRNRDSLRKSFLKYNRIQDILENITKRMANGYEEIDYIPMVSNWMNVIVLNLPQFEKGKSMSSEEKFSYVAGLIFESKTKNQEVENHDNEK